MKLIISIIFVVVIIALIVYFGFNTAGDRNITEKDWQSSDGLINASWGTEIIVRFEDGSTQNLNKPLPTFEIFFGNKKVASFNYVLSARGTSDIFNVIEIDISDFEIIASVKDQDKKWGVEGTNQELITLDMNGDWFNIYSIMVSDIELDELAVDNSYNLTFKPSGSITYRGSTAGSWNYAPLPNWFYLNFNVKTISDINDDGIPNDEDPDYDPDDIGEIEKWIEVETGSGVHVE